MTEGLIFSAHKSASPRKVLLGGKLALVTLFCLLAFHQWTLPVRYAYLNLLHIFLECLCIIIVMLSLIYPYRRLQQQTLYHTSILDDFPMGIMTIDGQLKISFVNQQAIDILGDQVHDLLGASVQTLTNRFRHGHDLFRLLNQQSLSTYPFGSIVREVYTWREERLRLKIDIRPLQGGGYLCLFTPAKREQELKNLQLQTRTILDSVNDLVILTDIRGIIVTCNRNFEKYTGLKKHKLQGQDMDHIIDALQVKLSKPALSSQIEGCFVSWHDRTEKTVLLQTSSVENVEHETIGYLVCATDITAFKKELQEIREQEKLALVGQMAAGIVHEIKNPLTTIKGFSQFLKRDTLSWQEVYEYAEIIEGTTDELNRVIMDFLSFARPRPPILERVWLNELILSLRAMLDGHLFIKGIEIIYCFCGRDMEVVIDSGQFKQVLLNLVKNAMEAVQYKQDPNIKIVTRYDDENGMAIVQVADNGKGIPASELDRLGTPFFTTKESGTGLGLSICYQIIREHNGRIEVESSPGEGTIFTIFLPCDISKKHEWPLIS